MLLSLPISPNDAGQRADRYLRKRLPLLGMGRMQSLFRRKEIKIAKKPVEAAYILQAGDVLQVYGLRPEEAAGPAEVRGEREDAAARPAKAYPPPPVLHQDDELVVVDKPAGMAVHPGTGVPEGASVIERVQALLRGQGDAWGGEVFSPALVHRLDKETSGVLLIARTGPALRALTETLRAGRMRKRYLALVGGHPQPTTGVIDAPLERTDSAAGAKSRIADGEDEGGKRAVTRYRTVRRVGDYALLEVVIETGRMHQIRAHLAHIGHPIVGDTRYDRPAEARRKAREHGIDRLFLHAAELSWREGDRKRAFLAPLPPDLERAVGGARGGRELRARPADRIR